MLRKGELVSLPCNCLVTVRVLLVFLTEQWVGVQCVIVEVSGHTHLLFGGYRTPLVMILIVCH